jgi:hypothetical protein
MIIVMAAWLGWLGEDDDQDLLAGDPTLLLAGDPCIVVVGW